MERKLNLSRVAKKILTSAMALVMIIGGGVFSGPDKAEAAGTQNLLTADTVKSITSAPYGNAADTLALNKLYDGDITFSSRYAAYSSSYKTYSANLVITVNLKETCEFSEFVIHMLSKDAVSEVSASSVSIEVGNTDTAGTTTWNTAVDKGTLSNKNETNYQTVQATTFSIDNVMIGDALRFTFTPKTKSGTENYQYQIAEIVAVGTYGLENAFAGKTVENGGVLDYTHKNPFGTSLGVDKLFDDNISTRYATYAGVAGHSYSTAAPLVITVDLAGTYNLEDIVISQRYYSAVCTSGIKVEAGMKDGATDYSWTTVLDNGQLKAGTSVDSCVTTTLPLTGSPMAQAVRLTFQPPEEITTADGKYKHYEFYEIQAWGTKAYAVESVAFTKDGATVEKPQGTFEMTAAYQTEAPSGTPVKLAAAYNSAGEMLAAAIESDGKFSFSIAGDKVIDEIRVFTLSSLDTIIPVCPRYVFEY